MSTIMTSAVRHLRRTIFRVQSGGRLTTGVDFVIGPGARLARGRVFTFGDRVNLGAGLVSHNNLLFGNDVMVSGDVAFVGDDHPFDLPGTIQDHPTRKPATTVLKGDNLIGFGTLLVGDIVIGHGTIVGAGSLVTSDLPAETVCVGRPARPIRNRRR